MRAQSLSAADGRHAERLMMTLFRTHLMTIRFAIDNHTQGLSENQAGTAPQRRFQINLGLGKKAPFGQSRGGDPDPVAFGAEVV